MSAGEESIEHLGRVSTFVWDLESRWQAESGQRRLDGSEGEVVLDIDVAFADRAVGGLGPPDDPGPPQPVGGAARHRGVVRRRAPRRRDHHASASRAASRRSRRSSTGSRTTTSAGASRSPTSGRSQATVDLDPVEGGTRVHLRWTVDGPGPADADTFAVDRAARSGRRWNDSRGCSTRERARSQHRRHGHDPLLIRGHHRATAARGLRGAPRSRSLPEVDRHGGRLVRRAETPRVGTRGRFRLAKGPIKGMLEMELTELDPDRRVVFQVTHPSLDWTAVSTLVAAGTGTRLTYAGRAPDARLATAARAVGRARGAQRRGGRGGPAEGAPGGDFRPHGSHRVSVRPRKRPTGPRRRRLGGAVSPVGGTRGAWFRCL